MGHAIHWYAKANKNYRKDYEKKRNYHYWDVINFG